MRSPVSAIVLGAILLAGCDTESSSAVGQSSSNEGVELPHPIIERQILNPFPNASELKLYVETSYDKDTGKPVLHRTNGLQLSPDQRERFESALKIEGEPEAMDACFVPHHFFRYFNGAGKQVGEVSVCFCCQGVAASGSEKLRTRSGEILSANYAEIENVVTELGEPTDVLCD